MIIESMELLNYRNYESLKIAFDPGTNIFYGDNAQGKTNVLEAVYLCCTTKSHRGARDREIIRFDQEEAHIKLQIRKDGVPYRIDMHLKKNKTKGIAINGIPIKKASQLFGVFFSGRFKYHKKRAGGETAFSGSRIMPAGQTLRPWADSL